MDILAFLELLISSEIVILDGGHFPASFEKDRREKLWTHMRLEVYRAQSLWLWHPPPKAFLLRVSRKTAGGFQGGRLQGRWKGRTNGQECQGH